VYFVGCCGCGWVVVLWGAKKSERGREAKIEAKID
jgi:hypothetical protein